MIAAFALLWISLVGLFSFAAIQRVYLRFVEDFASVSEFAALAAFFIFNIIGATSAMIFVIQTLP